MTPVDYSAFVMADGVLDLAAFEEFEGEKREKAENLFRSGNPFPLTNLPAELVVGILEQPNLSRSDLAACCRVSKALLPHAQHVLYSSVELLFTTCSPDVNVFFLTPQQATLFVALSSSSSRLAEQVKTAVFGLSWRAATEIAPTSELGTTNEFPYRPALSDSWIEENKVDLPDLVRCVLARMNRLSRLDLSLNGLESTALTGLHLPTVTGLCVPELFSQITLVFPALKYLRGRLPHWHKPVNPAEQPSDHAPRLTSLKTASKLLGAAIPSSFPPFLAPLLQASESTLTYISIGFSDNLHFSFASFTLLSSLRLTVRSEQTAVAPTTSVWVSPILDSLPRSLERFELVDYSLPPADAVDFKLTYLVHLPPSVQHLMLTTKPFNPSTFVPFLQQIELQLPHLKSLGFADEPWSMWSSVWGGGSAFTVQDWEKVMLVCAQKGLRRTRGVREEYEAA
ncbi:hypothetical protein JCM8097_002984 [Rhodosporidiobolus ruineniae]